MSYRSKRTRAEMMELQQPAAVNPQPAAVNEATSERWGPFCPSKKERNSADNPDHQHANHISRISSPNVEQPAALDDNPLSNEQVRTFQEQHAPNSSRSNTHVTQALGQQPDPKASQSTSKKTRLYAPNIVQPSALRDSLSKSQVKRTFQQNPSALKTHVSATLDTRTLNHAQDQKAAQNAGHSAQKTGQHSGLMGSISKTQVRQAFHQPRDALKAPIPTNLDTQTLQPPQDLSIGQKAKINQNARDFNARGVVVSRSHQPFASRVQHSKTLESQIFKASASKKNGEQPQEHGTRNTPLWKKPSTNSPTPNSLLEQCRVSTLMSSSMNETLPDKFIGINTKSSKYVDKSVFDTRGEIFNHEEARQIIPETFRPRRRSVVHDWPDNIVFDEHEEVLTMDAKGNYITIKGSIQHHDVWYEVGVKYCVTFNELYQPLKKGGHILVKFIGDVAKTERFCPIRQINWHHVNAQYKVDIIKLIRGHFVIPNGERYDEGILKRVGKSVRQYRHYLKKTYFKPTSKTREQIYQAGPSKHPLDSWIHLVDYWYSEKGKRFAECGKEARASQNHVHTTGSTSYANIRADFEERNKREPTELEIFKQTHERKDRSFVKDTITEKFLVEVDANIQTELLTNPSKSKAQIEKEAFSKLMYGENIPKRPLGYGYGVKRSDVFGVHGILSKEASSYGESNSLALQNMEEDVANLTKENKELHAKVNETNFLLSKILEGMSTGKPPTELAELAKTTLSKVSQIPDLSNPRGDAS